MRHDPAGFHTIFPSKRSSRQATSFLLAALLALLGSAVPAEAIPGPEQGTDFLIVINGTNDDNGDGQISFDEIERFDDIMFSVADGWDFGDREAYRCAFAEYVADGVVQFEVEFERLHVPGHDASYITINDRYGAETGEGGAPPSPSDICGSPAGAGGAAYDGSPFVPGGASLPVYRDGELLTTFTLPPSPAINDETFYSVGNEPGEAYMWYVEPGEANDAVLRVLIIPVAPGVSLSPEPPTPPPGSGHDGRLTLDLEGALRAFGRVRIPDGMTACAGGRVVVVQRRSQRGGWATVGRDLTTTVGAYSLKVSNRDGVYRARVLRETLTTGDVCRKATSPRIVYRRDS